MIGIYKITNLINDKCYVGQSINIENRWKQHVSMLNSNKHHSVKLQLAWDEFGVKNFKFEILEECDRESLNKKERFYINKNNAGKDGYNMCGEFIFYETLLKKNKSLNDYDLTDFKNGWDELLDLRTINLPKFYYYDLKFNNENSKTLSKVNNILKIIKNVHEELQSKDYNKVYRVKKVNFIKLTIDITEGKESTNVIKENIDDLLLDLLINLYYNKLSKGILELLNIPKDLLDMLKIVAPSLCKYVYNKNINYQVKG